jgi:hypothetical protein
MCVDKGEWFIATASERVKREVQLGLSNQMMAVMTLDHGLTDFISE